MFIMRMLLLAADCPWRASSRRIPQKWPDTVTADEIKIKIKSTNGALDAHIFEVRAY